MDAMNGKVDVMPVWPPVDAANAGSCAKGRWSGTRLIDLLLEWQDRARQRRALMALSDPMLKDIGLSRADAEREARKPFWRP
jgi:uncharacterized protein YjiS (DUF1127 family)